MSGTVGAVRAAADPLEQHLPGAARDIHDVARRTEHAGYELRDSNLNDVADGVRRLRQKCALVHFGGLEFAGFVLTRLQMSANWGASKGKRAAR